MCMHHYTYHLSPNYIWLADLTTPPFASLYLYDMNERVGWVGSCVSVCVCAHMYVGICVTMRVPPLVLTL